MQLKLILLAFGDGLSSCKSCEMSHSGQRYQFTKVAMIHYAMSYLKTMSDQNNGERVLYPEVSFLSRYSRRQDYGSIEESLFLETSLAFAKTFTACY